MKTAMTELIEMKKRLSMNEFDTWLLSNIEILLEKEKEQIIDAYDAGFNEANSIYQNTFSLDYYNQTYNQNK